MNFTMSELATLIRMVDKEENYIHAQIESEDENISDAASDMSVQLGKLSGKLKELYESQWSHGCNHPTYERLLEELSKS
jgi:hypothetical protein